MFLQNCLQIPGYPKISNFGYPVPEMTENTQPYLDLLYYLAPPSIHFYIIIDLLSFVITTQPYLDLLYYLAPPSIPFYIIIDLLSFVITRQPYLHLLYYLAPLSPSTLSLIFCHLLLPDNRYAEGYSYAAEWNQPRGNNGAGRLLNT